MWWRLWCSVHLGVGNVVGVRDADDVLEAPPPVVAVVVPVEVLGLLEHHHVALVRAEAARRVAERVADRTSRAVSKGLAVVIKLLRHTRSASSNVFAQRVTTNSFIFSLWLSFSDYLSQVTLGKFFLLFFSTQPPPNLRLEKKSGALSRRWAFRWLRWSY